MKKIVWLCVLVIVAVVIIFSAMNSSKNDSSAENIFRVVGKWQNPPTFNGNPYSPGGDNPELSPFIYGKLAIQVPLNW